ncbi:MAG: TVP38/TMEM64 family protein [Steroidobacteraceae bacterium]
MTRATLIRSAIAAVLVAAAAWALTHREAFDTASLSAEIHRAGPWGPLAFIVLYAAATVALLPGTILTLAGGALFGPAAGTFYNLTGATLGATGAFLVSRYLAADWVRRRLGPRTEQIIAGVEREDWRFVAFVRLVPLVPFNLLNYALGLTRVRVSRYVIASYLAMLPGTFAYTYLGYAGRSALAGHAGLLKKGLLAVALLACVALLPPLIRRLRSTRLDRHSS